MSVGQMRPEEGRSEELQGEGKRGQFEPALKIIWCDIALWIRGT